MGSQCAEHSLVELNKYIYAKCGLASYSAMKC